VHFRLLVVFNGIFHLNIKKLTLQITWFNQDLQILRDNINFKSTSYISILFKKNVFGVNFKMTFRKTNIFQVTAWLIRIKMDFLVSILQPWC
jgi:hypothetical protein